MMELDDERRLAVLDAVDQGELPQRTVPVEGVHRRTARELQDRLPCPGGRSCDPANMPVQVEMRIVAPPGGGEAKGGFDDALAQRGHEAGYPVNARDQGIPV